MSFLFWWTLAGNVLSGRAMARPLQQAPNPPIHPANPSGDLRGQAGLILDGPHVVLTKTVGLDHSTCASTTAITVSAGAEVVYCYFVTNIGTEDFALHNVVDDKLGILQDQAAFNLTAGNGIQPAALFTVSTRITQTTQNLATWTAYVEDGPSASASAQAKVNVPSIILTKTVGLSPDECWETRALTVTAGTVVYYCYTVQNTSHIPLKLHSLTDADVGEIFSQQELALAPHQVIRTVDLGRVISQTVKTDATGKAVWTAETSDGAQARAQAQAIVRVPTIKVSKTVGADPTECASKTEITAQAGDQVFYCYTVENTGMVTLGSHDVWDSQFGVLLEDAHFDLVPGGIGLFTITAEITQSINTSVTWVAHGTAVIPADASAVAPSRAISVTATAQAQTSVDLDMLASFTAIIFRDLNGNGVQESDEPGVQSAVVTLTPSATNKIIRPVDTTGVVTFNGLAPGAYTATVKLDSLPGAKLTTHNLPFSLDLQKGQKAQAAFGYEAPYPVWLPIVHK